MQLFFAFDAAKKKASRDPALATTEPFKSLLAGSADFMRVFAEETYGIPPPQVIGSTFKTHFEMRDEVPVIVIDPEIDLFDDKAAKPVAIAKYIGRQPIACFGNSDGEREMLQITIRGRAATVPAFGLIVHHTDAAREFAYDASTS